MHGANNTMPYKKGEENSKLQTSSFHDTFLNLGG